MLTRRSKAGRAEQQVIAALDVGTHKICCLIATAEPQHGDDHHEGRRLRMLGFGLQRSHGISAGAVVDFKLAQTAVAAAVSQAEQAAGFRIESVYAGLTAGNPHSRTFSGHVDLTRGGVEDADLARLNSGALAFASSGPDALVCLNRISFSLDGTLSLAEPRGLAGRRLEASHHAVTATPGPLENLRRLIESCQLDAEDVVPSAYASAIAATTREEQRSGVVSVDIGAAVTSIAAFADGQFVFTATLPFGGQHITNDIAQALGLPLVEAERIKTLYGSVAVSASDEHETLMLARGTGIDSVAATATRGQVCRIVARRTEWMLAGIRAGLEEMRSERVAGASVVLTGGSAEILGLEGLAASVLDRPLRVAVLPRMAGSSGKLPGSVPSPSFSCVLGLASLASSPSPWLTADAAMLAARTGYFGRVEQWLRESF
jgi:cell division protein FtsA